MDDTYTLIGIENIPVTDEWAAYTRYLSNLLHSPIDYVRAMPGSKVARPILEKASAGSDLIVWMEPERPWWQRWLGLGLASRIVEQAPVSVLVARRPRWPLQRILLVTRADESDAAAMDWAETLALLSGAAVAILPIVPPVPAMYKHGARIQPSLEVLLAPNTFSGAQLRHFARRLIQLEIPGQLQQHQGAPDQQMRREVAEGDHDLLIIAAEPYHWLHRWWLGELVAPLLRWVDRPVLIARPGRAAQESPHSLRVAGTAS